MIYTEREFYMEWDPIEEAEEYEIYLYNPDKGKYELKGNTRYSKYTLGYYEKFSQDHYYKIRAYSNSGIYKEAYGEFCDVTAKAVPGPPDMKAMVCKYPGAVPKMQKDMPYTAPKPGKDHGWKLVKSREEIRLHIWTGMQIWRRLIIIK